MRLSPRVLPRARPPTRKNRGRRAASASGAAVAKTPGPAAAAGGEDEELTRLLRRAEEALAPPAEARDDAPASPPSMFAPPPAEREGLPAARSHGKRRSGGRKPMATPSDDAAVERGAKKRGSRKKSAASQSSNEARSPRASTASAAAAAVSSGTRPSAASSSSSAKKKKRRFQLKSLRRKKPARTGAAPEDPPPKATREPSAKVPADVEKKKAGNAVTKEEREANGEEVAPDERPAADEEQTFAAAAVAGLAGLCGWGCGPTEEPDAAGAGEGPVRTGEEAHSEEGGGSGGGVWHAIGAWLSRDASVAAPNDEEVAKAASVENDAAGVPAEGSGSRGDEEGSAKAEVAADGKTTATNDEAKPQPVDAKGVERAVAQRLQAEEDAKAQTARLRETEALMTAERQRNAALAARIAAQDDELQRMREVVADLEAVTRFAKQQDASRTSTAGAPAVAAAASLDRGSFDRRPSPQVVTTPDAERWKLQAIIEGLEGDVAAERRRKEEALAAEEALRIEMDILARAAAAEEERAIEGDARTADRGSASLDSADRSSVRSLDTRETDEGHGWFAQFLPAVSEDEESTVRDDFVDWSRSLSTLESDAVGASRTESCELEEEEAEEEAESGLSWTGLAL